MKSSLLAAAAQPRLSKEHRRDHRRLHALMLMVTCCWAGNIIAGKVAVRNLAPFALAQLRVTASAAAFGVLFLGFRGRSAFRLARLEWALLTKTALFGITLNQLFFINGIERTSAVHAGLIVALGPVIVLALACTMRLEPLTMTKSVGTLIAFAGVALLTAGKSTAGGATLFGDVITFASTAVFAYYTILLKKVADRYDTLPLNTVIFCLGALFMLPFSAHAVANVGWTAIPSRAWACVGFMVALGTVVSYLAYAFSLAGLTAARVAAFAYVQPVIAISLGVWLLAEKLTLAVVLGGVLILLGVYLTEQEREGETLANG